MTGYLVLMLMGGMLVVVFGLILLAVLDSESRRGVASGYDSKRVNVAVPYRPSVVPLWSRHSSLPEPAVVPLRSWYQKTPAAYAPVHPSGRQRKADPGGQRAWAEIHLGHLMHNAAELQRMLPGTARIMAVIKADAYGHGSIEAAKELSRGGIRYFAVAEIGEGIRLRKHGIRGDILILGYTSPELACKLARYRLTQTLLSWEYGRSLETAGVSLHVHVKIDTGMNRLGEPYDDIQSIMDCYRFEHLKVTGTFSHLSMSDRLGPAETDFTLEQFQRFDHVIRQLRLSGIDPGLTHAQASYGILNYPETRYDLARPGIALYGLLSQEDDEMRAPADLRPVLSLKATVTQVKEVKAGHPVGYGYRYVPSEPIRIATVSIGYADGVPRSLSEHGGAVLIHGQRARIIGSICMDQLTVDVTFINGVRQGDTVTLIGQDGNETITAGEIAKRCGTVTNEIVSRLGGRVKRYIND